MRKILVSLAVLLLPIAVSGAATASTCATDPGAFFCEDWEKFTVGTSPAEWSLHPPGFTATIVTPGLNGTGKRLEGTVPPNAVPYPGGSGNGWIANGSCEGCPGGDHAMSASVPQGSRYWLEFTITYSPDY